VTTNFDAESENLRNAWLRHPAGFLDSYLIQGVENPCINPQSVTIRALLVDMLLPGQHRDLAEQEMLYSACACTTIAAAGRGLFDLFTGALEGEPAADAALTLPPFLKQLRDGHMASRASGNPDPRAMEPQLFSLSPQRGEGGVRGENLQDRLPFSLRSVWQQILQAILHSYTNFASPFESLWHERLASAKTDHPSMLEVACGSANDFRYWARYGLDALIDYTGVDICPTNVANAQRRCPTGTFREGNALALPFPDKSFDFYLTFDLFEHLSLAAMHQALREAVRVTRRKLWLSYFSIESRPEHLEVPSPPYYLNILSLERTLEELSRLGCDATVIDLPAAWSRKFPGYQHYNPRARIIEVTMWA
jgi:SAM-dependent methyltransferase